MRDPEQARRALEQWAVFEGLTLDELSAGVLCSPVDEVVQRYATGQPVPTALDVFAFLFPGASAGVLPPSDSASSERSAPKRARPAPIPDDPRAPARLLASVMVADGSMHPSEQAHVARFLEEHQMEPLAPEELRPWRPYELGPVRDLELARAALKSAVQLMHLDGVRDPSELRIVRTYARAWGVDDADVQEWDTAFDHHYAPALRIVWRALSRWVR
jgi:uncharacterized tellurite resistance protein B-like protein